MIPRNILKLALVLLTSTSLLACGGKKNDPVLNPQGGEDTEKLVIADLKAEIEIVSSQKVTLKIFATKGFDPNIYRDGRFVSQGNYESESEAITNLNTSITHKGKALSCGLLFHRMEEDETKESIEIKIKVKLYKNGKLTQEYENTKTITPENDSTSEEFQLWGKV